MKRSLLALALLALPFGAAAQQSPTTNFTLSLSSTEVVYIAEQLRERPYKDVVNLLAKIQGQLNEQAAAEAAKKAPAPASAPESAPEPAK